MKTSGLVIATATVTSALIGGIMYASQASSQPKSLDVSVYTPIGVVQSPGGAHTIAWLLDSTNRRVVMCSQKMSELNTSKIDCRAGDLPNP
jgi:hypothetical protein